MWLLTSRASHRRLLNGSDSLEYRPHLEKLLKEVAEGKRSVDEALQALAILPYVDRDEVKLDFHRSLRRGIGEVVYCPGKSEAQLSLIASEIAKQSVSTVFSRMEEPQRQTVLRWLPALEYRPEARFGFVRYEPPIKRAPIAVLSAGSVDVPVAEEAALMAEFAGCEVARHYDVGVSGLHRLLDILPSLREKRAIIVAAGMEGALPSVVSGLVEAPVIALPTSKGYGISAGGFTALAGMLASCSPGVVVVNIDNGIGAGTAAALIADMHPTA